MSREMREIFINSQPHRPERRRGLDRRGKIGLALSVAGWSIWAVGMYLIYFALPQQFTYFDYLYNKSPSLYWRPEYIYISLGLWTFASILCLLSLYQFRKRYRRRRDKRHYGIMTALLFNLLSIMAFILVILIRGL